MHFNKAFCAQLLMQEGKFCSETFALLVENLQELPPDHRGAKALELSAVLVELAAYELAGKLDSQEIGALIHCSAELSERALELKQSKPVRQRELMPALQ